MPFKSEAELREHVLQAFLLHTRAHSAPAPRRIEGDPYPGLRAFLPTEADRFFGRDAEADALLQRLLLRQPHFLALIGASGSGKSSLVYAGLMPRLSRPGAGGPWLTASMAPREMDDDPFNRLAWALAQAMPTAAWQPAALARQLRGQPATIAAVVAQGLSRAAAGTRLLLSVDQFEELFAHKVDAGDRTAFFSLLAAAAHSEHVHVVVAMRSDFYDRWPQDEASVALLHEGHFPVALPGLRALEDMIVEPARAKRLHFDPPQLVQRILHDTGTEPGALALAEFALARLYDQKEGDALTEAAYQRIGGVAGAIDGLAEKAVAAAQAEVALDDDTFNRLFTAIASVEERGPDLALAVVRRRATLAELPGAVGVLAQHLVAERLLVSSGGQAGQPAQVEVRHEKVFSHWRRFTDWYKGHATHLALRRQAKRAAAEWHKARRPAPRRWGWERQKPALLALLALSHRPAPPPDPQFTDAGMVLWQHLSDAMGGAVLRDFLYPEPRALLDELQQADTTHQRLEEIGLRLNRLPDPRRGTGLRDDGLPVIDWVDVPAGRVTLRDDGGTFAVAAFRMARYPVTWCQYEVFMTADDGYANLQWWEGRPREDQPGDVLWGYNNHPVVNTSWYDALAFCRWLGARLGCEVRLPTESEWQWAAVGDSGGECPLGEWDPARANSTEASIGRTVAVGLYPAARSPFGLEEMAGNVNQWCRADKEHPPLIADDLGTSQRLLGRSWFSHPISLRSIVPFVDRLSNHRYTDNGFRVCRVSQIEEPSAGTRATDPPAR